MARYDDDYRGRSSGYDRSGRERDDQGRFMSGDDHRGGSRSSSRYDDDDRRYSSYARDRDERGRFTGGDDHRRGGYDRSGRERDDQGRFVSGDDRGYGRSSGRYDDDDRRYSRDRGQGWFGDSEGHAEAARRGWEHRRDDDDYRSGGRSSGRYDDDDRRYSSYSSYSRDRGQGGWFGDREGHAEAARRGWEHRRDDDDYRSSSRGRR